MKNAIRYFQIKATKKANALTKPVEKKEKKVKEKILLKICRKTNRYKIYTYPYSGYTHTHTKRRKICTRTRTRTKQENLNCIPYTITAKPKQSSKKKRKKELTWDEEPLVLDLERFP